jgi:hypothetical protein
MRRPLGPRQCPDDVIPLLLPLIPLPSMMRSRSMPRPVSIPRLALPVFFAAILASCQQHRQSGSPEGYVENGVAWAFGSVQLTDVDAPGSVVLKRLPADQNVDGPRFRFFAAISAEANEAAAERELAYVDFHPSQERLLAYNYQLDFSERPVGAKQVGTIVDVHAVLRKGGRSFFGRQKVHLGSATFTPGADNTTVNLAAGLSLSLIANGVYSGQWALHYPQVARIVPMPWQGQCPKSVTQAPGQNPSQNPGQFESCKPLPPKVDLCEGNPCQEGCRPKPPLQSKLPVVQQQGPFNPDQPQPAEPVKGQRPVVSLEAVADQPDVFIMPADVPEAKVLFVHDKLDVGDEQGNALRCAKAFFAVARSVDDQENASCFIKPAPASPQGGKLTCAVSVRFEQAQTYLEKVCNITAIFRGEGGRNDTVQVLKR